MSHRRTLGSSLARAVLWGSLALAAGSLILVGSVGGSPATLVDIATDATDPLNLGDTEPSIAVNPTNPLHIAVVSFSEPWGPGIMAPVWQSTNGGTTWAKIFQIPRPPSGSAGPNDQKVAFDAAGRLYVAELGGGAVPDSYVYRQTGAANAPLTAGAVYGDDQPHLDIDRSTTTCVNQLYSPWLNFGLAPVRSVVSNSATGGAAMANVVAGVATFANRTTRIALDPAGRAYIVFKTREGAVAGTPGFENAHFRVKRSDDCGVTWTGLGAAGVSVHGAPAVQTFFTNCFGNPTFNCTANPGKVARARSSDAWIAVDPGDGDIFVAYVSRDASGFGQIYVARSSNQGASWTSTRATDGTRHSAFPEIAVTDNGTVGVLYVDAQVAPAGTTILYRHRFTRSFNSGTSWSSQTLQTMDAGPIANATSGFLWGDYEGLTAWGNSFYGVFTGESIGRTTLQLDPIFFTETGLSITVTICIRIPGLCGSVLTEPGLIVLKCARFPCILRDPIPKNCLVKFNCPGCSPGGLCPPWYTMFFDDLDPVLWSVGLFDDQGKAIPFRQFRTRRGLAITFRPSREQFVADRIANYELVFQMTAKGKLGFEYRVPTRLERTNRPYSPGRSR